MDVIEKSKAINNTITRTSKKALFDLIKSLTKAEKRDFKLSSFNGENRNDKAYVKLFNLFDKQIDFNEDDILEAEPSIRKSQLPNLKKYLYDALLNTITTLKEKKDIELGVNRMLDNIRVLHKKKLFEQCRVIISKALVLAKQYELFYNTLELLEWETKLQIDQLDQKHKSTDVKGQLKLLKDRKTKVKQINSVKNCLTDLEYLRNEIFILIREKRFRESTFFANFEGSLESHPVLLKHNQTIPNSFKTLFLYYQILGIYYITIGENERSLNYFNLEIKLVENNLHFLEIENHLYAVSLYNFILNCTRLSRFDESFYSRMEKLKAESKKGNIPEVNVSCMEITSYSVRGAFKQGVVAAKPISDRVINYKMDGVFIMLMDLYFDLMYLYFGAQKFEQSLFWLNKIINSDAYNSIPDLYSAARIMQIIIHYELGNVLLLNSLTEGLENYLKTRKSYGEFEKCIIRLFTRLHNPENKKDSLLIFKNDIKRLDEKQKKLLVYFELDLWVDSKLTNQLFEILIKNKFTKSM